MTAPTIPFSELAVNWLAAGIVKTNRGKRKAVLTGEPTRSFWRQWQRHGAELRRLNLTLKNYGKGKWEVVLWLNKHNLEDAALEVERRAAKKEANGKRIEPIGNLRELFEACIPDEKRVFDGPEMACVMEESDSEQPF